MPSRAAHGATALLSGPPALAKQLSPALPQPADCQVMVSCCPAPAVDPVLPPGCSLVCLKSWVLKRAKAQHWALGESSFSLPLSSTHGGHAGTAPSPSWLPGWMADCKAIFLRVPLYSWLSPVAISSHSKPASVTEEADEFRKEWKVLLHSYKRCSAQQDCSYQFKPCQKTFKIFSVKGRACIKDSHVQKRGSRLQSQSPHLNIMRREGSLGQVESQTPQSAMECSNQGFPLASQQHGCKAFC